MLCTLTKHSSRDKNEKSSLIEAGLETFEAKLNLDCSKYSLKQWKDLFQ